MKTKVFVANEESFCEEMRGYIEKSQEFEFVGSTGCGEQALERIRELAPDVVILDILLSGMDGFALLESLSSLSRKPKTIVATSLNQDNFVDRAIRMGATYYMIKPISPKAIAERIRELARGEYRGVSNRQLDERISNIFITVGIPAHIKGYQFLREAIKMTVDSPDIINSITKRLYPSIAAKYETSSSKVERAIRHAIEVAWNRGKIENINTLFGIKVYSETDKPTNGEFIALVADKMLIEGVV